MAAATMHTLTADEIAAVSGGVVIGILTLGALADAAAAAAQELARQ